MRWVPFWPCKHRYCCVGRLMHAPKRSLYQCTACHDVLEMNEWQLRALPWWRARCRAGTPLVGMELFEYVIARKDAAFDCYDTPMLQ